MESGGGLGSGVPRGPHGQDGEPTQDIPGRSCPPAGQEPVTRRLADAQPDAVPRMPTEVVPGLPAGPGPGGRIAGSASRPPWPAVERAWRSGRLPFPPHRARRMRLPGTLLTVALLAAAGLVACGRGSTTARCG